MNRLIKTLLAAVMTFIMVGECNKLPSTPEKKSVQFSFHIQYANNPKNASLPPIRQEAMSASALQKALDLQAFDMVRIMVIDLSAYGNWEAFTDSSETGKAYAANRLVWNGDPGNWAEWKKFWQDYATVVCDQPLEIQGQEAVGSVTGVIGYNQFVAGIFKAGRVRYWAGGSGYGEEGETHEVTLEIRSEVDPCLTMAKNKSPEEAVFNAAFGE